jgi:dihydroorotase
MTDQIILTRPDDWHLHLRDGDVLADVVPATAERFGRAIIMPNLAPPVTTAQQAMDYRDRILAARGSHTGFEPLMTLYLTGSTTADDIREASRAGIPAAKLYPAGATTNSASGVRDVNEIDHVFATMAECGMLLLVHGEVTHDHVDIFDREKAFIDQVLTRYWHATPRSKWFWSTSPPATPWTSCRHTARAGWPRPLRPST